MNNELTQFWHFFFLYRNQLGYGLVAAVINALVHYKHNDSARDSVVDVVFCGCLGWGAEHLMSMMGMPPDAAILAACIIGASGMQIFTGILRNRFGLGGKQEDKQ